MQYPVALCNTWRLIRRETLIIYALFYTVSYTKCDIIRVLLTSKCNGDNFQLIMLKLFSSSWKLDQAKPIINCYVREYAEDTPAIFRR